MKKLAIATAALVSASNASLYRSLQETAENNPAVGTRTWGTNINIPYYTEEEMNGGAATADQSADNSTAIIDQNQTADANATVVDDGYCPDFAEILGQEGGSLDNITAVDCDAFKQIENEINLAATQTKLAVMHGFLGFSDVGKIGMDSEDSEQESQYLDYLRGQWGEEEKKDEAAADGEAAAEGEQQEGEDQQLQAGSFEEYLANITREGYRETDNVYSSEYRLYLLENQVNLAKKYIRNLVNYNNQLVDYVSKMYHNQKLLEWGFIRHEQRLNELEDQFSALNETVSNQTASEDQAQEDGSSGAEIIDGEDQAQDEGADSGADAGADQAQDEASQDQAQDGADQSTEIPAEGQ